MRAIWESEGVPKGNRDDEDDDDDDDGYRGEWKVQAMYTRVEAGRGE